MITSKAKHKRVRMLAFVLVLTFAVTLLSGVGVLAADMPEFSLKFDGSLVNTAGNAVQMHGDEAYGEGVTGASKAIALDYGKYVQLEDAGDLLPYDESFTIAFWFRLTGTGAGGDPVIMGNKNWDSGGSAGWAIVHRADKMFFNYKATDGTRGDITILDAAGVAASGEWTHVAVTLDYAAATVKTYANGVLVSEETGSLIGNLLGVGPTLLGQAYKNSAGTALYNSNGMYRPFLLSNFRLTAGALSDAEVAVLAKRPNPAAGYDFWLPLDAEVRNAGTGDAVTYIGGDTAYRPGADGEANSAIALSYADYISVDDSDFDYSQSFSVAFWIQLTGAGAGGDPAILGNKNWDSGGNPGWAFNHVESGLRINYTAADRGDIVAVPTAEMMSGQWNHVVVTFNYEDNEVKVYKNGQVVTAEEGKLGSGSLAGLGNLLLGQAYANGGGLYNKSSMYRPFNLDEFIMVQKALTPTEVAGIYNQSVPEEPFVPTDVAVIPGAVSLTKGSSMRFVAEVSGTGNKAEGDDAVTWTVTGAQSAGTEIDTRGNLTVGADETSASITVKAISAVDNSVFGTAAVTVTQPRTDGKITFGVVSDVHVGSSDDLTVGNNARAAKAFQFLSAAEQASDAVLVVGDLTSNGSWREFSVFQRLRNDYLTVPLIASMGNHDENQWDYFERATGSLANDVQIINGYYFIMVSPGAGSLDTNTMRATQASNGSYSYIASWLSEQIATAEAADPTGKKPIFVFFHHPMQGTHYLSDEQGSTGLYNVLDGHNNVIAFSGHTHGVNNHPLDIWQDGGFTTVNTAATCAGELSARVGAVSGNVPSGISESSQGLYVTADDDGNVSIKTRDFLNDRWLYDWTFNVNEELPYTTNDREARSSAPVFPAGAEIRMTQINMTAVEFEFDRAAVSSVGVDDFDYYYRYVFINKATGTTEKEYKDWSAWFRTDSPAVLAQEVRGLTKDTQYELRIYAVNAYGVENPAYLSKTFSTTAVDNTYHAAIDYRLSFDNTLDNAGTAPATVTMFGLEAKPENYIPTASYGAGVHGQAIHLQPNNFVDLDGGATLIDYDQSFSTALWVNVEYVRVDGDPVLLSNKNVDSSANKGWAIYKEDGNNWLSLTFAPTVGAAGRIRLVELAPSEWIVDGKSFATDTWIHLAVTFDYANNKITAYVNGENVGEADANLAGGIGGVTGEGKNKSTFLGSSPWNYTEEHGGYNGSGSTNDVMHNGALEPRKTITFWADDFVLSSCLYTQAEIVALMGDVEAVPEHFTVTFDTDGGTPQPVNREVYAGRTVSVPVEPGKSGYTFDGWYSGGTAYDFNAAVTGNLNIKAQWKTASSDNGGSIPGQVTPPATGGGKETAISGGSTVKTPAGKDPVKNPDGSMTLPGGGTITTKDGTKLEAPAGTVIDADGSIHLPRGNDGATINYTDGSSEQVSPGHTVEIGENGVPKAAFVNVFRDVTPGDWFYDDVVYVYTRNLMSGTEKDLFSPDTALTRGMAATILYRLAGEPEVAAANPFTDVASGKYYVKAVTWAAVNGIVTGISGGLYDPEAPITREQLATIFRRYGEAAGVTLPEVRSFAGFSDSKDIADYAKEAAETLFRAGIINGKENNTFDPKGTATRAEAAAMLHRFLEAIGQN